MTKWKQPCFILSTKFLKLQTYLNCHFPNSCIYTFDSQPPRNFDYCFFGTCISPQMSNRVFFCKHIIYPEWKCILVDFLQRSLVPRFGPKIFLKILLCSFSILLCSFSKTIPKWPVILPKDLLIFIWYAVIAVNYLYYCFEYVFGFCIFYLSVAYLLPRQLLIPPYLIYRHPYVVFICLIWLCLHAFWCFHYSFIKYYVFNSKLLCACNRCCVVDPYDFSPTLCDSITTSIC